MGKKSLSKKIYTNIPFIMNKLGRNDIPKNDILMKYFDLEGVSGEVEFGGDKDKYGRLPFGMLFASTLTKLKKEGIISSPKRSVYTLEDESIPNAFLPYFEEFLPNTKVEEPVQPEVQPNLKPTVGAEPVVDIIYELENPAISTPKSQPATIAENDGDGRVQITTTTLEPPIEEQEVTQEVTQEEIQEEIQEVTQEVIQEVTQEETQEVTEQVTYDIKALRSKFDPNTISVTTSSGVTYKGNYLTYRDVENRKVLVALNDRSDFLVIPVDVTHTDPVFQKYAEKVQSEFDSGSNHNTGSKTLLTALAVCKGRCQHTDDFAGYVEDCTAPQCPVEIWKGNALHVEST